MHVPSEHRTGTLGGQLVIDGQRSIDPRHSLFQHLKGEKVGHAVIFLQLLTSFTHDRSGQRIGKELGQETLGVD